MLRRSLLLLASVAVVAIGGGAIALAESSTARPSSTVIVCPLAAGVIVPCCGPPVTHAASTSPIQPRLCCPPNALCAIPLTIASAPDPSTAGGDVTVSGRMSASLPAGSPVVLWQRLPGRLRFARALQVATGATGQFTIVRAAGTVQTNRLWYVTAGGLRSQTVDQQVHADITLAVSASGAAPRNSLTFSGRVSPSHAGQRVVLEQFLGRSWQPIASLRLDHRSKFTIRHSFARHRAQRLRAVLPGDRRNIRSLSPVITT